MKSLKIAFKTSRGIDIIQMEDILCCIAHGRYTKVITLSGKEYLLSKVLKQLETCLEGEGFFRTHKSYLVNLRHLVSYENNHENPIALRNNIRIPLAKRRKQEFQAELNSRVKRI